MRRSLPPVDVLVIGAGLAGVAAALEAAAAGASVAVASASAGSSMRAQGGIAACVGEGDSPELHLADTLAAGAGLCDREAVATLTRSGPATIAWLTSQGIDFDSDLGLEGAHSLPRIMHVGGDASGRRMMLALSRALAASPVRWLRGARLVSLVGESECHGAVLSTPGPAGRLQVQLASTTILATGGYAGLYARTTNARINSGKGIVEARRRGARLAGMEFVQFHPTVSWGAGRTFLLTEALRGAGARVIDRQGRRFLFDHDSRGELAPRDIVARSITEHLERTGEDCAFLSVEHLDPAELAEHFPLFLHNCHRSGLDPRRQPIPIAPGAHYSMGGVVTDLDGRTGVRGLLAAGECAWTGVHGANRLASNSLLEAASFGRRTGQAAAQIASRAMPGSDLAVHPTPGPAGHGPAMTVTEVGHLLTASAGVLRDRPRLELALGRLHAARARSAAAADAIEIATLICTAALDRRESVGAHTRTDQPTPVAV